MCALVHLYHLGVLHSDIKPANVLISHSGAAVLTDFGNAKEVPVYDYATWKGYSRDGTCPYMAPEMVRGAPFGTGADVWSMGLVFLEILDISPGRYFESVNLEGIRSEHATMLPVDAAVQPALVAHPALTSLVISVCGIFGYLGGQID